MANNGNYSIFIWGCQAWTETSYVACYFSGIIDILNSSIDAESLYYNFFSTLQQININKLDREKKDMGIGNLKKCLKT